MSSSTDLRKSWDKRTQWLVGAITALLAFVVARPYAGGWNDGSRLATVETLVDQHTWKIDKSIFVHVSHSQEAGTPSPYDPSEPGLLQRGTLDKLLIGGHYYSDKSPVPALLMACCYQLWETALGWTAQTHPDRFCLAMTRLTSGLAYVVAVLCIHRLSRRLRMPLPWRLALTASFGLATVALPYAQQVNNHILLLAVTSALTLALTRMLQRARQGRASWRHFISLGFLAGLGYTIDLGAGPVVLFCTALLIASCCLSASGRSAGMARWRPCLLFALAAVPWLGLHHILNYSIGGSWKPANANPAYFCWPGSPFDVRNLTGRWIHPGLGSFLLYAASMLAGKRGFLGHNLPLFLAVPAIGILLRRHREHDREVLWAIGCLGGTWLLYAATSNNSSGQCLSIRWFVPMLAPGYYILGLFLQRYPQYRIDFLILSAWGGLLALLMYEGPWIRHMVPGFWPIQGAALFSWAVWHHLRRGRTLQAILSKNRNADDADLSGSARIYLLSDPR